MFPETGYESQIVACIENTGGIDVAATIDEVSERYDMAFSNGYGSTLGERAFRSGHMGEHDVESSKALTEAIEDVAGLSVPSDRNHDSSTHRAGLQIAKGL